MTESKFYTKTKSNTYAITKSIKNETIYYHTFKTREEAENAVKYLKKNNWDKKRFIYDYLDGEPERMKYIKRMPNGKYSIQKYINGEYSHFGTFDTLEEAIRERDICVECDWDYDLIVERNVD